jgi:hypothetical protein
MFVFVPFVSPLPASFAVAAPVVGPLPASAFDCAKTGPETPTAISETSNFGQMVKSLAREGANARLTGTELGGEKAPVVHPTG